MSNSSRGSITINHPIIFMSEMGQGDVVSSPVRGQNSLFIIMKIFDGVGIYNGAKVDSRYC